MESELQVQNSLAGLSASETAATTVAVYSRSMIEAKYLLAIRHPRDLDVTRQKLLKDCNRPGFASAARYHKPIGKGVEGPSIRFAEAALRYMKNIDTSTITIFDDREKRVVRVTLTDIEENVSYSQDVTVTKTVERRKKKGGDEVVSERLNSYGDKLFVLRATDDDILNKQNSLISKAIRTLGLRLVPGDIIDECMDAVVTTMRQRDKEDPDAARRKILDSFLSVGVKADSLKEYLGHDGTTLNPKEMTELRSIYTAIRDEETTWNEVMDSKKPKPDDTGKKQKQTTQQKFNTQCTILKSRKMDVEMNEIIKGVEELSGIDQKKFTDTEFNQCVKQMKEEIEKNG